MERHHQKEVCMKYQLQWCPFPVLVAPTQSLDKENILDAPDVPETGMMYISEEHSLVLIGAGFTIISSTQLWQSDSCPSED